MKYIKGFFNVIDKVLEIWCVSITIIMTLLVIISVFLRYLFNITFIWSEELIIFIFIATTYFGIILCVLEKEHIDIDFFKGLLPKNAKVVLETIISMIVLFTVIKIANASLTWIDAVDKTLTPGLKIPYKYLYTMMPISFLLVAVYEIRRIVNEITISIKNRHK